MGLQHWLYTIPLRLRSLFKRGQIESELDEELRYHVEQQIECYRAKGLSEKEARYMALREIGGVEQQKERCRTMRKTDLIDQLRLDLSYAFRLLIRNPVFTGIVIVTLALGIGANTAIFSVINTVLLRPLPYPHPDRLMMVWVDNRHSNIREDINSYPNYIDLRDQNKVFEYLAAYADAAFEMTGNGEPARLRGARITANFFQVMGVDPFIGRPFKVEEEDPALQYEAIISHGLWQRRFGGDPGILNKTVSLSGKPYLIVGVMPASFDFPAKVEVWSPLAVTQQQRANRGGFFLPIVGRLKPDVPISEARSEMISLGTRLERQYPVNQGYGVNPVPLYEQVTGKIRPTLLILLGAVAFVLLIACANIANLLLSRAAVRQKEFAIRAAVGAGRGRIVRQLLTESLILALVGGTVGLALAVAGTQSLKALAPPEIPRLDSLTIDIRVLLFTIGISLLTGVLFGLVPSLQAAKPDLNETFKDAGRGTTSGLHAGRIRDLLVISEIALSLMLLIGAGLLLKSFQRLLQVNPGMNPNGVLTLQLSAPRAKYTNAQQVQDFYQRVVDRLRVLPGVDSVGGTTNILLEQIADSAGITVEGRPVDPQTPMPELTLDAATPNYFQTMGIPLLKGRWFTDADINDSQQVAIINESMVRQFWPNDDPIGKRFQFGGSGDQWITIVGVIKNVKRQGLDSEDRIQSFLPFRQYSSRFMQMVIRSRGDLLTQMKPIREAVWSVDSDVTISNVATMNQLLAETYAERRFTLLLLGLFSAVALTLATVGIYGVMAYNVAQRTHEIGIRMALGAQTSNVFGLILSQGMKHAVIGIAIGAVASFALTRLLNNLLFNVSATDPVTFLSITALLAFVALLACYVPARRAAKIDPMIALRYE